MNGRIRPHRNQFRPLWLRPGSLQLEQHGGAVATVRRRKLAWRCAAYATAKNGVRHELEALLNCEVLGKIVSFMFPEREPAILRIT